MNPMTNQAPAGVPDVSIELRPMMNSEPPAIQTLANIIHASKYHAEWLDTLRTFGCGDNPDITMFLNCPTNTVSGQLVVHLIARADELLDLIAAYPDAREKIIDAVLEESGAILFG